MRIRLYAGARPFERASRPIRSRLKGQGIANLTLPSVAALIPRHHDVSLHDEQAAPLDLDAPMDLAMVTSKTSNSPRAYEIADTLRRRGVPVVMGGCHASLNPDEAAQHADAVVIGEAERVMPQLLEDAARGRLAARYQGEPVPMDEVPLARRDLLQKRYFLDGMTVSRGCNHACRFCCIRKFYGQGFRGRPAGQVAEEVRQLGPWLGFLDENLFAETAYAEELFQALTPLGRTWLGQAAVDVVARPHLLEQAARSGCAALHFGFETVNQDNLRAEGKLHNDVTAYAELVRACHRSGILVAASLLFGLPHDTPEVFRETVDQMTRMGVDVCYFRMVTPYPGTKFHERVEREGRLLTRDRYHYDGYHPTFVPHGMSPRRLLDGTREAARAFYAPRALGRRVARATSLKLPLWATLNINRMAWSASHHARDESERILREASA